MLGHFNVFCIACNGVVKLAKELRPEVDVEVLVLLAPSLNLFLVVVQSCQLGEDGHETFP